MRSESLLNLQKYDYFDFFYYVMVSIIPETSLIMLFILGQLAAQMEKPSNPFVSILNVIGVFGSGVLGSLYAIAQKEKMAAELAIESVSSFLTRQIFLTPTYNFFKVHFTFV